MAIDGDVLAELQLRLIDLPGFGLVPALDRCVPEVLHFAAFIEPAAVDEIPEIWINGDNSFSSSGSISFFNREVLQVLVPRIIFLGLPSRRATFGSSRGSLRLAIVWQLCIIVLIVRWQLLGIRFVL